MARPKQVSDEQLLEMARTVFLEQGPGTPVAVIAKRLGVTSAALFHRVGSKEALLLKSLWPPPPPEHAVLAAGLRPGTPLREQLVEILVGLTRYLSAAVPAIFMLQTGQVPVPKFNRHGRKIPEMLQLRYLLADWLLQALADRGMTRSRADALGNAFLGTLEAHYLHGYLLHEAYSPAKARELVRSLVDELLV